MIGRSLDLRRVAGVITSPSLENGILTLHRVKKPETIKHPKPEAVNRRG